MNFKDLQYSIGRLTTDVRGQLARNNPLQKQDTKALSMWIFNERNNLATMRTLAYQQSETNKVFQQWTKEELLNDKDENGRDIEDIGDKLVKLLEKQTEIEQQYAAKHQQYRHAIKSIRDREDRLSDIREKKRTLSSRITNLTNSSPKSPKLRELQKELNSLDRDTHDIELEMGDFKRFALKEAFYLRFNAMNEYAEKTAIIAGFGKYIVDLLDIAPTPATEPTRRPYEKGIDAAMIFADAMNALDDWQPDEGDERPTIASNTNKYQGTTASTDHGNSVTDDGKGKGKDRMESEETTGTTSDIQQPNEIIVASSTQVEDPPQSPPELPPRSPVPSTPAVPGGYTSDAIALVTSDHKSSQDQEIEQDLNQLNLYDTPPPAYEDTRQQDNSSSPRNSYEPVVVQGAKDPIPDTEESPNPSLPPAPATEHARPIAHEDKEQVDEEHAFQSPYQPHQGIPPTPSTPQFYQQSPQPIHQMQPSPHQPHIMYHHQSPHHHHSTMMSTMSYDSSMNWNIPGAYGGVEPKYHHGQYQQLYDQLTERQQHGPVQRPYAEFQQQYCRPAYPSGQDAGGFRIPSASSTSSPSPAAAQGTAPHLSADEEKRQLAEKFAREETQARQASIQTLHQEQKPLPPVNPGTHKKSVITPEGEEHGYKPNKRG
ncbi:Eisosome component PIL1-domain-containing protein [Absidia repens]|uniref:Eisosome component PIL1-domain-containing protein n=1 Tax=Absidia repens TaxID=90262 RepID=A0A1X2I9C0_9FUNG|nr:Eisosome component PIL1-domain-containing protein [Absidia repens]